MMFSPPQQACRTRGVVGRLGGAIIDLAGYRDEGERARDRYEATQGARRETSHKEGRVKTNIIKIYFDASRA